MVNLILIRIVLFVLTAWAAAALWFDCRITWLAMPLAIIYAGANVFLLFQKRLRATGILIVSCAFAAVLTWWLNLRPSNDRNWQPDVAMMPWAEVQGDTVNLHNIRDFDYTTETNYKPAWRTKRLMLSQLQHVDLFLTHWGAPGIAHAIVSFVFADENHIAMSIEVRKEIGEQYSALRGFFRQYELIYLAAEERDVVRLRTNYRPGESVYLYRTMTTPDDARRLLLQYLTWMAEIKEQPQWYNALTSNCTSGVTTYLAMAKVGGLSRWDWRNVLNGFGDQMLYGLGDLASGGLSFEDLKKQALVNAVAQKLSHDDDFSKRIRESRVGFRNGATQ